MIHEPYNRLRKELKAKSLTYDEIAKTLGISKTSLAYKIMGKSDFYVSEVIRLCRNYELSPSFFNA